MTPPDEFAQFVKRAKEQRDFLKTLGLALGRCSICRGPVIVSILNVESFPVCQTCRPELTPDHEGER